MVPIVWKIGVFGGYCRQETWQVSQKVEVYSPSQNSWTEVGDITREMAYLTTCSVQGLNREFLKMEDAEDTEDSDDSLDSEDSDDLEYL